MNVPDIVAAIRSGRMTPADVLENCLARHGEMHATLRAFVQMRVDAARQEAGDVATRLAGGGEVGPLAGVPTSVKECFAVRGLLTTLGIPSRRDAVDEVDADIVTRLRAAGAVVVGKANVPQAMLLHETDNPVWGRSLHPTHPERSPGGSSGGDAALVAAGVVPLAVGTDLAGSIRQPSHSCGIAGIVPQSATLGEGGAFDTMPHLRTVRPRAGLLARRVDDLRCSLAAITTLTLPTEPRRSLRVGWFEECGSLEPSPAIRRAVREAVARLEASGAVVSPVSSVLWADAAWMLLGLLSADGGSDVRRLFRGSRPMPEIARLLCLSGLPRWLRPLLGALAGMSGRRMDAEAIMRTGPRSAAAVAILESERAELERRLADLAARFDAIVCPVSLLPALRHGTAGRLVMASSPCFAANLFDLPAGSVPVTTVRTEEESGRAQQRDPVTRLAAETDRGSRGLPVGVQVVGLRREPGRGELLVLDVMERIESS